MVLNAGKYRPTIHSLSIAKGHWVPIFEVVNNILNENKQKKAHSKSASSWVSSKIQIDNAPEYLLVLDED